MLIKCWLYDGIQFRLSNRELHGFCTKSPQEPGINKTIKIPTPKISVKNGFRKKCGKYFIFNSLTVLMYYLSVNYNILLRLLDMKVFVIFSARNKSNKNGPKMFRQAGRNHRQLKEVDCSLARPAYLCCIDLPPYSVQSGWPATYGQWAI